MPMPMEPNATFTTHATETLENRCPTTWSWQYESDKADLQALYEKAKQEQWEARTALDWTIDVDPERENLPDAQIAIYGTDLWDRLDAAGRKELRRHAMSWTLSQFLHGEQGALLASSQIVDAVPWMDAKLYASTQVMDEARHVEVYERYLREKVELVYPIDPALKRLLDEILADARWDVKYLGMQVLVEGLALAAFRFIHTFASEPLIRDLTAHVMQDEARHVAFGVLSLRRHYAEGLNEAERNEREDFAYEACRLMRDRFLMREVWQNLGFPVEDCLELSLRSPAMAEFRRLLFSRIVPNVKRLGLLSDRQRARFQELGILAFEDLPPDA